MKSKYHLIILFVCVFTTSCARNIAEYPHDWPEITKNKNGGCVNLSGIYFNKAYDSPSNRDREKHEKYKLWSIYLSELLVPYTSERKSFKNESEYTVELKGVKDDKLEVIFRNNEKIIYKKELYKQKDFTCGSRFIEMKDRSSLENMMGITERFEKIEYGRGDDESMIVSVQETDIGTIVIVPYSEKVVQYYRFLPLSSIE